MIYIFFLNIIFIFCFSFIAKRINLLDQPNIRKQHIGKVPLVGGIAIYLSLIISIYFYDLPYRVSFSIYLMFFLVLIGFLDDLLGIHYLYKIIVQIIIIILTIGSGIIIADLGNLTYFQEIRLGKFSFLFTFICILGLINAINFIDGIDGFASGSIIISLISLIFYKFILTGSYDFTIAYIALILIFAFFVINIGLFNLPKVFLGDAGSVPLGFLLGIILVVYSQKPFHYIDPVLIPWCIAIPIFDLLNVSIKRMMEKKNPFMPDNKHIHFLLLKQGLSQRKTLLILLLIELILSLLGIIFFLMTNSFFTLMLFPVFFVIYFFIIINYERKYS